ncbi:hypothetical protein Hanom_Chr17g01581721 [Helianthus anomalus]
MGEDTLEFKADKKELSEERETFTSEKKGLLWRVADAEDKHAKEKQFDADRQKEWETAREQTNWEMKSTRDEIIVAEKIAEIKASEILAEEANTNCKWLLARNVPLIVDRIVKSDELAKYMFDLGEAAYDSGRKEGYGEERAAAASNEKEYEFLEFAIIKAVEKLSRKGGVVEILKKALGDQDPKAGDAWPSHQVVGLFIVNFAIVTICTCVQLL